MDTSKISFYFKRLSVMSLPEMLYRIRWKLDVGVINRIKLTFKSHNIYLKKLDKENLLNQFKNSKNGNFFFEHYPRDKIIKEYKKYFNIKNVEKLANQYCQHVIPIYDVKENLGKEINWNKDYKTNKVWPKKYVGNLHHADPKYGYVRYVWELNRHSYLDVLAKAYYLTNQKKYAEEILAQIESWIEQNPYAYTINWFSGLELGIRVINWIWCLKFIQNYPGLSEKRFKNIIKSIYLQTYTVFHSLSLYSSANNHLTGELAALKLVSQVFPYFKNSKKWNKRATQLLQNETINQTYDDGVGAEQSTNYLIFILDLYLQSFITAENNIPKEYKQRLEKAGEFLLSLNKNRKIIPDIGDSDYAHLIDLEEQNRDKTESILASLAILYSNKEFKHQAKKIDEKTFWIFGIKGLEKYKKITKINKTVSRSKIFHKGGYLISQNNNASLIFDCGGLGYLSTAGHGHCDALSILLTVNNKEFFIDPGTYVYHNNEKWRNFFKSTEAHNTIKIDNINQSEIKGTFIFGRKAKAKITKANISEEKDEIIAYHDGYKNIGVIHGRYLIHNKLKKEIKIQDNIKTKNKHSISLFFNLHPDVEIEQKNNVLILKNKGTKIELTLDKKLKITRHKGNLNPIRGWYSPRFGIKMPCYCIELQKTIQQTSKFITKINY